MWTSRARRAGFQPAMPASPRALPPRDAEVRLAPAVSQPGRHNRGSALLAVLWLSAALAAIAFSLSTTVRGEIERTSTAMDGLRSYYIAAGAVERAAIEVLWSARYPDKRPLRERRNASGLRVSRRHGARGNHPRNRQAQRQPGAPGRSVPPGRGSGARPRTRPRDRHGDRRLAPVAGERRFRPLLPFAGSVFSGPSCVFSRD